MATRQPSPVLSGKVGPEQLQALPTMVAIFLDLFGSSAANRGIHTDDPTGYQLISVARASATIIPPFFMPDALPSTTLPICHGLQ